MKVFDLFQKVFARLWALTFFSITKDDSLDTLEYHAALRLLQPYIKEIRKDHVLVRGLSLAEMESILSAQ